LLLQAVSPREQSRFFAFSAGPFDGFALDADVAAAERGTARSGPAPAM